MKERKNRYKIKNLKKATALAVVFSLLFTLIEQPILAASATEKEKTNLFKRDSYYQLRKDSQLQEGGRLASSPQILGMVSNQLSPDVLIRITREYQKQIAQQLKQVKGEDSSNTSSEPWINMLSHNLTRISALHIGRRTIDLVKHANLNSPYQKMPAWRAVVGKVYYMVAQRGILKNDYLGHDLYGESLADYYEILDERWKLSDKELNVDPRRLEVLNELEQMFYEELSNYPRLGIIKILFSIRRGEKVMGLDEEGNIETAMLAPFIIKKKRYDYSQRSIPFSNSLRSEEALFSPDIDLIDSLVSLRETNSGLAQRIMKAIPKREFKVQELYLGGAGFDIAHLDPSVLEISGHDELEIFLRQVAKSKLEEEMKEEQGIETAELALEDKIAETRAYIKFRWSDETLENYKSIINQLGQGIVTIELVEMIYELRNVPGLGDLINQLYHSIEGGSLKEREVSILYNANNLRNRGEEVISLNLNLADNFIDIITYNEKLDRFNFYSLNDGFNENKKKRLNKLLDRISRSEEFSRTVDFLLDAKVYNYYSDKLFQFLKDGNVVGRNIISGTDGRTLVELKTLDAHFNIVANIVTLLIFFGLTLGVGLSGVALAFDGTILPQNAINWEPILLGGIIGATVLSFASRNTNDLKKSILTKRDEIKSVIFKIAGALKGSFESLNEFFSVIASKDPNIRILINGEDPVSVAESKDLIEKIDQSTEESTDDKIGNKLQFIVVGNFHGQEVSRVLAQSTVKGISSKYVKKIIDRPTNNEKIDLKEVLDEMNEDKTFSKEEYTLWIMNSSLWDISKFIESIAQKLFIKNGTQLLYVDMIRGRIVGASQ